MSTLTADQGLVLPDTTDNDAVPASLAAFAAGVELRLFKVYASIADRTARNPTPTEGQFCWLLDLNRCDYYSGAAWVPFLPTIRPVDNTVATQQGTSSTAYVDLATVGPSVTVTGLDALEITVTTNGVNSVATNTSIMSFAISGSSTLAASDTRALIILGSAGQRMSMTCLVTGLTPGVMTITAKYRVSASNSNFQDRNLMVRVV
jgi:hypothetical protein